METLSHSVILVDDSDNLRSVIKEFLELKGYNVWDFKEMNSALKSINTVPYHLCIIDLSLHNQDNFVLLQNIRKYKKSLPVISYPTMTAERNALKDSSWVATIS